MFSIFAKIFGRENHTSSVVSYFGEGGGKYQFHLDILKLLTNKYINTQKMRPIEVVPHLKNEWNHFVRNMLAIFLPSFTIFGQTLLIITKCSVYQEDYQEPKVKEREETIAKSWQAPGQSQNQFKDIVHVSGETPEATDQKFAFLCLAIMSFVFHRDKLCFPSPNDTFSSGHLKHFLLVVSHIVQDQ